MIGRNTLKKCQVMLIHTKKETDLWTCKLGRLHYKEFIDENERIFKKEYINYYNIYFLSDEKINKGDWVYDNNQGIYSTTSVKNNHGAKKVIASSDKYLDVPGISDNFIIEYCKLNGINEVLVNYVSGLTYLDENNFGTLTEISFPRINEKYEVSAKFIKQFFKREEVENLVFKAFEDSGMTTSKEDINLVNNWINENV